jgi:hypothetical protein
MLRTSMGSSVRTNQFASRVVTNKLSVQVQLPTYNWTKNQLVSRGILPADSIWTYLASSSVSGVCVVCNPFAILMLLTSKDS